MKNKQLKNGLELVLTLALALDLLEQYQANNLLKKQINIAKKGIEKALSNHYDNLYKNDEEFIVNSVKFKERVINQIAKYNEADCILASHFLEHFDNNIDLARKKGVVFFDKLL